eukprot:3625980-Amphidinium_carterae.1
MQWCSRVGKISLRMFELWFFPATLPASAEPPVADAASATLIDGSGKHPAEPSHRRGGDPRVSYPLPGCWQSVYRAELHAIMVACEMKHGNEVIVADCKGAGVVANKLKAGLRKPRWRHSHIAIRIRDAIGDIQVQWMTH